MMRSVHASRTSNVPCGRSVVQPRRLQTQQADTRHFFN
jgi:hypothetical protein